MAPGSPSSVDRVHVQEALERRACERRQLALVTGCEMRMLSTWQLKEPILGPVPHDRGWHNTHA